MLMLTLVDEVTNYHLCRDLFQLACPFFSHACALFVLIWLPVRKMEQNKEEIQMFMKFYNALAFHQSLIQINHEQFHRTSKQVYLYLKSCPFTIIFFLYG